jgi:hypothetical protein
MSCHRESKRPLGRWIQRSQTMYLYVYYIFEMLSTVISICAFQHFQNRSDLDDKMGKIHEVILQ